MQILATTDFSTRSNRALRQAGLLAKPGNSQLNVLHVVDDDQPEDWVRMEKREAERLLTEQISSMPELQNIQARPMVVMGDPFDGILRVAADCKADLIVMGSHRKQLLLDIFTGTTIERVIRKGTCPVLMVNNEAQQRYENVVAPVEMSETSADALRAAVSLGLIDGRGATLLHGFMPLAKGKMFIAGTDQADIDRYVATERRRAEDELSKCLAASDLSGNRWSIRAEEGSAMEVISRVVSDMRPDLLVMGTHQRSGLSKALIGSVTEQALRSLSVDILAIPPKRR